MERMIFKLTGQFISFDMDEILKRLGKGMDVTIKEIDATPEMQLARTCISYGHDTIYLNYREVMRQNILNIMRKRGSAIIGDFGETVYEGDIVQGKRLDIVLGLPASGRSTVLADRMSAEFHSRLIDNKETQKNIIEYNKGWGARITHKEAQTITDSLFHKSIERGENIVLVKVGKYAPEIIGDYIIPAKGKGYNVTVNLVDLNRNKAISRMLTDFVQNSNFRDPELIEKYAPIGSENCVVNTYRILKKDFLVDGYSCWNNDVPKGEKAILTEKSNIEGKFIDEAPKQIEKIPDNVITM